MQFQISRKSFLEAVHAVSNLPGKGGVQPILSYIHLEADIFGIRATATDSEIRTSATVEAELEKSGETALPCKKLLAILGKLQGDSLTLQCDRNQVSVITCGSSRVELLGLPPQLFPEEVPFTPVMTAEIREDELMQGLDQAACAVSNEAGRKVLQGINIKFNGDRVVFTGTDGKRLALSEKSCIHPVSGPTQDITIPLKAVAELKRIPDRDGSVKIRVGEKQVSFENDSGKVTAKLFEAPYPSFPSSVTEGQAYQMSLPVHDFLSRLELVSLTVPEQDAIGYVRVEVGNGRISLSSTSREVGNSRDSMPVDFEGEKTVFMMNPGYLADPFRHVRSPNMTMSFNDPNSPIIFRDGSGFLYSLMPLRENRNKE